MKTDVITISNRGSQIGTALNQVDKVAAYKELSHKAALQLRLLTEELTGMVCSITGETEGEFWIEDEDGVYSLHFQVTSPMYSGKREQLLSVSTSGKNEAARGLMGRLRAFFDQGEDYAALPVYHMEGYDYSTTSTLDYEWTMSDYQSDLYKRIADDESARAQWDELEKSVVNHVADEIKVSIRGNTAEMTIIKKLS